MKNYDVYKFLLTAIAVLLIAIMFVLILRDVGLAERIQEQVWVLCDPESYVTLREGPGKKKPEFGGMLCGSEMWTDNVSRNGFLHVMELPAEETEGWIHDGDQLTVWWMSDSWAVTSRGYIQSKFIGEEVIEDDPELPRVW